MGQKVHVFSLAWDNENGCGCEVYATEYERDATFREALVSFLKRPTIDEKELTLDALIVRLEQDDFTDGARYTPDSHIVEIPDGTLDLA